MNDPKIIVALDFPSLTETENFLKKIQGSKCRVKVGKELFTAEGPKIIDLIHDYNLDIFLDLKFHDIPNTVAKAIKITSHLGIWMVNVHAAGGKDMMCASREAIENSYHKPLLIAVTILTSFDDETYEEIGYKKPLINQIQHLAKLAEDSKMDGIVCSANDISNLNNLVKKSFKFITPGIRLGMEKDDQKRVTSPRDAISMGSNYIVIGRPITKNKDPFKIIEFINQEIQ